MVTATLAAAEPPALKFSPPFSCPPTPPVADAVAAMKEAPLVKDRVDEAFPPAPGAPPTLVFPPPPPTAVWVRVSCPAVAPLAALNKVTEGPSLPGAFKNPTPAPPPPPVALTEAEAGPVSEIAVAPTAPMAPPNPPGNWFPLPAGAPLAVEALNAAPPEAVLAKLTAEASPPFPPLDPCDVVVVPALPPGPPVAELVACAAPEVRIVVALAVAEPPFPPAPGKPPRGANPPLPPVPPSAVAMLAASPGPADAFAGLPFPPPLRG